ncbi:MAG: DNA starvation/stationary phase protection protein [Bacteroidota bacterium]|nr:DNA starvation/stationary phase protection protein [Bacteroidota bacterium]
MHATIGITEENLNKVALELNKILADEYVLYTKTKNAHWNIEGPDFHSKHLFFEGQFTQLDEMIDSVAERIRSLGHYALGSLKSFLGLTHFSELLHEKNNSEGFIRELLTDHESIIIHLRENINLFATDLKDIGTSDFLTGLMETHEKMAWMLRSHLK